MTKTTYPDPHQFTIMDRLLHANGTHALCIQAEWLINNEDMKYLREFSKTLPADSWFLTEEPMGSGKKPVWRIFDIPVKIMDPHTIKVPELSIKLKRRVW